MKKINSLLFTVVIAFSGVLFTSCEKEANMIVRNWTLQSKTIAGVSVMTDCEKDSRWNFKSDGTYAIYDSCDNTDTGTWELADDSETLTLNDITVYQVNKNSIVTLIIEMQVGGVDLVRWEFN